MIVNDFWFDMKDGRRAFFAARKMRIFRIYWEFLAVSAEETDFLVRSPEGCRQITFKDEKNFIDRMNQSDASAMIVCLIDEKIVGTCSVSVSRRLKIKHRAAIGPAVLKKYWNQGIGSRMIQELICIAESNRNILRVMIEQDICVKRWGFV